MLTVPPCGVAAVLGCVPSSLSPFKCVIRHVVDVAFHYWVLTMCFKRMMYKRVNYKAWYWCAGRVMMSQEHLDSSCIG